MDPHRPEWNRQTRNKLTRALKELQQEYEQDGRPDAVEAIDDAIVLITHKLHNEPGRPRTRQAITCHVCGVELTPRRPDQVRTKNYCRKHHPRNDVLSPRDLEIIRLWNDFPDSTYQDLADHYGVTRQRIEQRLNRLRSLGHDLPDHHMTGPPGGWRQRRERE